MTDRKVYMDRLGNQARLAVVEDGKLVEMAVWSEGKRQRTGNLYLGRVVNVLPGLEAAFVDVGLDKNAFLPLSDVPPALRAARSGKARQRPLRAGEEIIVQVVREPGGEKAPRLTMNPSFPGKFCVLLPTVEATGVSRHVDAPERREALEALARRIRPEGMGVVLRTAADDAEEEAVAADLRRLVSAWEKIAAMAQTAMAPALLYEEEDLAVRAARDLNAPILEQPFDSGLEAQVEKATRRRVWLDSGAYLVFDRCEAMTVVDVNSGKFLGKRGQADTLLRLNCEAAREIARQIRLRDIGGIIVVDFVDMDSESARAQVLQVFEEALSADRAKRHVFGFTGAGLLEMTRRPVFAPLLDTVAAPCPVCAGSGWTCSAEEKAHAMLRGVRRRRAAGDASRIVLSGPTAVMNALRDAGAEALEGVSLQERTEQTDRPSDR